MKITKYTFVIMVVAGLCGVNTLQAQSDGEYLIHKFEKKQLSWIFYAEGAGIGDMNQDGVLDIVAGPYWYEGPDFDKKHTYQVEVEYDRRKYSENFIVDIEDVNDDGWNDIMIVGFPGKEAYWYENPKGGSGYWERHLIHSNVDNESPVFYDMDGDGKRELVFHTQGVIGYARRKKDVTLPWEFIAISEADPRLGRFTHGFGIGDIDGDGLEDIVMARGWWKNPGMENQGKLWEHTPVDFGSGGAQMHVYDVNNDGLDDVITTLAAHGWGMAWYEQEKGSSGKEFRQHLIMGENESDNKYGVSFAEAHAIDLVDMDNDGIKDLVTGKRFWAHGPDGHYFHSNAAVLYWFKLDQSGNEPDYIPYLINYNSGVGVEVKTADLTGNGLPDIVVSNKKGTFVFFHETDKVSKEVWEYFQPRKKY